MSQKPSLHRFTVDRIAGLIVGGTRRPGDLLPTEAELGAELGVSRTVVREAMRTLVAKGMVTVRRRHGARIAPLECWSLLDADVLGWRMARGASDDFVADLVTFRLGIEPMAAALAAENPEFPDGVLTDALARMSEAAEGHGDWAAADLEFHNAIVIGARNQFLAHLTPLVANTLRASIGLVTLDPEILRAAVRPHRAVAAAIAARDPGAAHARMVDLVQQARDSIAAERAPAPQRNAGAASAV